MSNVAFDLNPAHPAPAGVSRRACLGWAAAGAFSPLLSACGGGSGGGADALPPAPVEPPVTESSAVRWCIETLRATLAQPGTATQAVSVALLADDQVIWREAFGYADRDSGRLATPDTRFNVASVAKMAAALSVMILRDRGLLALDQPLVELLPDFSMRSPAYTQITVRHLISHASGVPGNNFRNGVNTVPYPHFAQDTLAALAASRLKHAPGDMAMYCNDGFTLVAPLVEALSGVPYPEFVRREILVPLEMHQTGYALALAPEDTIALPYYQGKRLPQQLPAGYATGGLISTATDLLQLARLFINEGMHAGKRIVSVEAVREMGQDQRARTRIVPDPTASLWRWGLGWDSVQQPALQAAGLRTWNKSGAFEFYSAQLFVLPEARLAVAFVGSGLDYDPTTMAEGAALRLALDRGAIQALPPTLAPRVPALAASATDTGPLTGVYGNTAGPLKVQAADDGSLTLLRWEPSGWTVVQDRLRARTDGYWWADGHTETCLRFQTVGGHRYLSRRTLVVNKLYWDEEPIGEWLPPLDTPLPPAWLARLGTRWKRVNDLNDSLTPIPERAHLLPEEMIWGIGELPDLPGYVLLDDGQITRVVDDQQATMAVQVPVNAGRDLMELNFVAVDGEEELHSGVLIFRQMVS